MTLYLVMPGLQIFLSAYLCTFRVCAKDKNLRWNFKRIRRRKKMKGWQTYCQQFRLVKIFANDTLLSCARATDISICLPMHIQGLCQRQKPWRKNRQMKTIRQTDKLTGQRHNLGEKNFKTIRRKAWKKTSSQDEQTNWLSDTYLQMFCIMTGEKKLVLLKKYM